MGAVRDNNFFVVHGWMINHLGLKGTELELYAIIYGFSQAEGQQFHGGLQYLADWTNVAKRNVLARLQALVEKGLLVKTDVYTNGVKTCEYRCVLNPAGVDETSPVVMKHHQGGDETSPGVVMKHHRDGDETSLNNISHNIPDNIPDKKEIGGQAPTPPPETKPARRKSGQAYKLTAEAVEAILCGYAPDEKTLELLRDWMKVRKAKRAPETEKALTLNLTKLQKYAKESGLSVHDYLEAVIARGWAAFFPIRETAQRPGGGFRQQPERSRIKTEDEYEAAMRASGFKVG